MNRDVFYIMIILTFILLGIWIYNQKNRLSKTEGFQQQERFLLKTDLDSYDDFYSEIYDQIMLPKERSEYELDQVLQVLQPDQTMSIFLDIGSGTGTNLAYMKDRGYKIYGLEQSQAMINASKKKHPDLEIKCDNVENPMAFDRSLFTHILCMNYTIYEIENKQTFFNHCYYWLKGNGYLILHLVEKNKFNTIIPAAIPSGNSGFDLLGKQVLKTEIDFHSFNYSSEYASLSSNRMILKESFQDKQTQNVRQNERTLYMDSTDSILEMARKSGFIAKGSLSLEKGPSKDRWQQIIILERLS
jgi:SAM-dependent methyltransferase